ncbi:terpenoid synthase [Xylariaceae sp. FL0594]|nr:terpenoid synthase [Xylariaceae sp. FL0594]
MHNTTPDIIINERAMLASRLVGQRLVIPDMRPMFEHWPSGQHGDYADAKGAVDGRFMSSSEKHRRAITEADPALLAARWWPTISSKTYSVMTDLTIWFGLWDDVVERMTDNAAAAEDFRLTTKEFIRRALGLGSSSSSSETTTADGIIMPGKGDDVDDDDKNRTKMMDPLIQSFQPIAAEAKAFYNHDQLQILLDHFDRYIDSTRLEHERELSTDIPSLKDYWEVRILTSGMGTLLGLSEYALQVHLPPDFVRSEAYSTLWVTTVIINSVVNDLLSLRKEMKAKSVLNSVAILFHQYSGNLDLAVELSLSHLRQLIDLFDRTADAVLASPTSISDSESETESESENESENDRQAIRRVIDLMRTVNTGNLAWSLQAKRYDIAQHLADDGVIDLIL